MLLSGQCVSILRDGAVPAAGRPGGGCVRGAGRQELHRRPVDGGPRPDSQRRPLSGKVRDDGEAGALSGDHLPANLGAIRRKPEIRYKSLDPARELPALQYRILEQAAWMVRPGGILQYSTCTLHPAENEQITARFLREHPEFSPRVLPLIGCFEKLSAAPSHEITLFPHIHGTDGFYIAGFYKRED